jgi:hypothetical protein
MASVPYVRGQRLERSRDKTEVERRECDDCVGDVVGKGSLYGPTLEAREVEG